MSRISKPRRARSSRAYAGGLIAALVLLALCIAVPAQAAITHPYTGVSFGPEGVGSSNFLNVTGTAVNQTTGDVYVLDPGGAGGRLFKFDGGGKPVDFSSTPTNVIEGVSFAGGSDAEIAVDSSKGPDAGDIYVANDQVVKVYSAAGTLLGELSGGEMCGVAVDPAGNVYVGIYPETIRRYSPAINPVVNGDETGSIVGAHNVCNVAADNSGDVYTATFNGGVTKYSALQFGSLTPSGTPVDSSGRTLAVDPVSSEVFIDAVNLIVQYDGNAEPPTLLGTTGASGEGSLSGSFGVAVDHASGKLYVGNGSTVEIFGPGENVVGASTGSATGVSGSVATLHGTAEPAGTEITSCEFEYGTEAGALTQHQACSPPAPYSGSANVEVTAAITGLSGGTTYHYRTTIEAAGGPISGRELSFKTTGPTVSEEAFHGVGTTSAVVNANVSANGQATVYSVEYGPTTAYGSSTDPIGIGAGEEAVPVQTTISGLPSGAVTHLRFVAENAGGTTRGTDLELTTHPIVATGLPDGRGYELVTPAENEGSEPYSPAGAGREGETAISTGRLAAASDSGNAVTYAGSPTAGGNGSEGEGLGNQLLTRRNSSGGWTQEDIQPAGYNTPVYWGFSSEFGSALVASREAIAPGGTAGYADLYVRNNDDGTYRPVSTVTPPSRSKERFGAAAINEEVTEASLGERFAGASADYTHVLLVANDVLAEGTLDPGAGENNLYDSVDGVLHTVNILPDESPAPGASFGGPTGTIINGFESQSAYSHAISADGRRIFWTDMNTGSLYVREDDVRTALIAESATYLTASADGSKVLYTKAGDLFEDDLNAGVTRDLAPGGEVLGLMGAGENLDYVYFVAQAALATGATAGQSNMYVEHEGHTKFVATLGSSAEELDEQLGNGVRPWAVDLGYRSADVNPSGSDITFMSTKPLTGYDNVSKSGGETIVEPEVFVYDAGSTEISCASCDPTGEPPAGFIGFERYGGFLPVSRHSTFQLHLISEDGDRVFFGSDQQLLPQAQNSKLNVYEWERDGSGTCTQANGCISLLSSGESSSPSFLIDASANGDDVFLMTRSQLVPADKNEYNDIYDAHVGAVEPGAPTECTGTGCQGVAASPPVFATPASVTFNGVGNFAAPSTPVAKPKPKPKPKKKKPACTKKAKKSKAKRAKSKPAQCKTKKKKPAKRARRDTNRRGGR